MTSSQTQPVPLLANVLHPSDFSEASLLAFAHALKVAIAARTGLFLLHASTDDETEWADFPGVRDTLVRWGLLPRGSSKSDLARMGVDVVKVIARQGDPVQAVLGYLDRHGADLIVLATHHHGGPGDWLHKSVSEPLARKSGQMTLFVPSGVRGFVSLEDGSVSLRNILLPIASKPRPQPATSAAARLVELFRSDRGVFTLLHVGSEWHMPAVATPDVPGWQWQKVTTSGDVIEKILEAARRTQADLIVMPTDGRHGFLDALRGSHSERILRHAPCPLLAIPQACDAALAST